MLLPASTTHEEQTDLKARLDGLSTDELRGLAADARNTMAIESANYNHMARGRGVLGRSHRRALGMQHSPMGRVTEDCSATLSAIKAVLQRRGVSLDE